MATSYFTDGRNEMYITGWIVRSILLFTASLSFVIVMRPFVNPDRLQASSGGYNMLPNAGVFLIAVVLFLLAVGQAQYAYHLASLNRLLEVVAKGRNAFSFKVDDATTATVKRINQQFRIEVLKRDSEELFTYVVSGIRIEAFKLTGALSVVNAGELTIHHEIAFEEVPFKPDIRKEMVRLKRGLLNSSA